MKKALVALTVIGVLAIGVAAFAQGWGNGGPMMGPGYGMMGYGMGPGGCGGPGGQGYGQRANDDAEVQKFLDETATLRKELHVKMFDYREAARNPKTDDATLDKLEAEIDAIQEKIQAKAPKTTTAGRRGFGPGGCNGPCGQR